MLLVYLCHALPAVWGDKFELLGWAGVALFFVISGFCIHLSYLERRKKSPDISLSKFAWSFWYRRFWRIYPPYFAALVAFWLLQARHEHLPLWHFWTHLFLVNNFNSQSFFSIAPPFWSLAVEWQFYLMYPFFLWLLLRGGLRLAFIVVIVETIAVRCGLSVFQNWHEPVNPALWASPVTLFFDWSLGVLLAEMWSQQKTAKVLEWIALPAVVGFIFCECTPYTRAFAFTLASLASAGFVSIYLRWAAPLARLEKFLIPLGVCSYSFYLWHDPLIGRITYWLFHLGIPDTKITVALMIFIAVPALLIAWSWAAYKLGEKPSIACGRWLQKQWETSKPAPATELKVAP